MVFQINVNRNFELQFLRMKKAIISRSGTANQPVVGWLEGLRYPSPPGLKSRCSHLFLDHDDFVNFKMTCRLSLSEVLIGVECACVRS